MKLGIRAHDLGRDSPEKLAQLIADANFQSVQLVLNKAVVYETDEPYILCDSVVTAVSKSLKERNIEVAMLGAYFNPIHSNKEKVKNAVDNFKFHLQQAKKFHTNLVGTETGSYNDDQWTYHELNSSEEAFNEVKRVFEQILIVAKEENAYLAIEPAYHHVISTPTRLKRLINELNHSHIQVTFDLFNLLYEGNYDQQHQIIDEMIDLFKDKISIVHAKDFIVEEGKLKQVAPGKGWLDYPYLFKKLQSLANEPVIIFEGVTGEDIEFSRLFIKNLAHHLENHSL